MERVSAARDLVLGYVRALTAAPFRDPGSARRRRVEPVDQRTADPLEFLVVLDVLEPAAARGPGQGFAEQGQGGRRVRARAGQTVHDVVRRRGTDSPVGPGLGRAQARDSKYSFCAG
ncbi:hypothetical protein Stsp02_70240 [Streptomyces sp. NBRC 14336]|nr:hypothetical protein Stsp02_70240 [Streptomyces sp. NBRC 14336]